MNISGVMMNIRSNGFNFSKRSQTNLKMAVSLAALMAIKTVPLLAAPQGGSILAGSAEFTVNGLTTTVKQNSDRAVLSWQSFNLANNETVNFDQPSANSATLNRILDSTASHIGGTIKATGTVYFVNPNGLVFDASSRVTANRLIASTIAPSNLGFMFGQVTASYQPSATGGAIRLNGRVEAAQISALASTIEVQGSLDASSDIQQGGLIELTAAGAVKLGQTAVINASGAMGGGSIAIGGNFMGAGPLLNAAMVEVVHGARISADATGGETPGDGGTVVIWSQQQTDFAGLISARGANQGGNGGTVEVSGQINLIYRGTVDTQAPKGKAGTLILDPTKISIVSDSQLLMPLVNQGTMVGGVTSLGASGSSYLLISNLQNALATSNVTIDASTANDGEIDLGLAGDRLQWSSGNSLTLKAKTGITIRAGTIDAGTNGSLILTTTNGDVKLENRNSTDNTAANIVITAQSIFMNLGTGKLKDELGEQINADGAKVYYQGAVPTGGVDSVALNLGITGQFIFVTRLTLVGEVTLGATGVYATSTPATLVHPQQVSLSDYRVTAGGNPTIDGVVKSFTGISTANALVIKGLKSDSVYDSLAYIRGNGITLTAAVAPKGSLVLESTAGMNLAANLGDATSQTAAKDLTLLAAGTISQSAGLIQYGQLSVTTKGSLYLGSANRLSSLGRVSLGGDGLIAVETSQILALAGDINLGLGALEIRAGGLTLQQDIKITAARATVILAGVGTLAAGSKTIGFSGEDFYYLGATPTVTSGGSNVAIALGTARFTYITRITQPEGGETKRVNLAISDNGFRIGERSFNFSSTELSELNLSGTGNPNNRVFYGFDLDRSVTVSASGSTSRLSFVRAAGIIIDSDFSGLPNLRLISSDGIVLQGSVTSAAGASLSLYSQGWIDQKSGIIETSRLVMTSVRTAALGSGIALNSANRIASLGAVNGSYLFNSLPQTGGGQVLITLADSHSLSLSGDSVTGGNSFEIRGKDLTIGLLRNISLEGAFIRLDLGQNGVVNAGNFTLSAAAGLIVYTGLQPTVAMGATTKALDSSAGRFVLTTLVNEDITISATGVTKTADGTAVALVAANSYASVMNLGSASFGVISNGRVKIIGGDGAGLTPRFIKGASIVVTNPAGANPVAPSLVGANYYFESNQGISLESALTINGGAGNLFLIANTGAITQSAGFLNLNGLTARAGGKIALGELNQIGIINGITSRVGASDSSLIVNKDSIKLQLAGDLSFRDSLFEIRAGSLVLTNDVAVVGRQLNLLFARVKTVAPLTYLDTAQLDAANYSLTGDGVSLFYRGSPIIRGAIVTPAIGDQVAIRSSVNLGATGRFTQLWKYEIAEDITIDDKGVRSTANPNYQLINESLVNLEAIGVTAGRQS